MATLTIPFYHQDEAADAVLLDIEVAKRQISQLNFLVTVRKTIEMLEQVTADRFAQLGGEVRTEDFIKAVERHLRRDPESPVIDLFEVCIVRYR
jgi:hypothetical protein